MKIELRLLHPGFFLIINVDRKSSLKKEAGFRHRIVGTHLRNEFS